MSQGSGSPRRPETCAFLSVLLRYLSGQAVVGVGVVDACGAHLVELLAVGGDGVGEVDDVEDLGPAEAGDLHGSHAAEAVAWARPTGSGRVQPRERPGLLRRPTSPG